MPLVKFEAEVNIPEGWKFVRWGKPKTGDYFYSDFTNQVMNWTSPCDSDYCWIIVEKDDGSIPVLEMKDRDIGIIVGHEDHSYIGRIVQRRGDDLISFLLDRGADFTGLFMCDGSGFFRVRLLDKDKIQKALENL